MLTYKKADIQAIPLEDKFLLPLPFDPEGQKIANSPFSFYFDDTRNVHFSVIIDFMNHTSYRMGPAYNKEKDRNEAVYIPYNINEIIKYPRLIKMLLGQEAEWKEKFKSNLNKNTLLSFRKYDISLMQTASPILNFIKDQYESWLSTEIEPRIYNPTVIVPFIHKEEYDDVIVFCREHLINLVVFDFLNYTIKATETKTFWKTTISYSVVFPINKVDYSNLWAQYYKEGSIFIDEYSTLFVSDSMSLLKNYRNIYLPRDLFTDFDIVTLNNIDSVDKMNFLKFYYSASQFDIFSDLKPGTTCSISMSELKELVSFINKEKNTKFIFNIESWKRWVNFSQNWSVSYTKSKNNETIGWSVSGTGTKTKFVKSNPNNNWTVKQQREFLEFLIQNDLLTLPLNLINFSNLDFNTTGSLNIFCAQLEEFKINYPGLWGISSAWLISSPIIFNEYFKSCSVRELIRLMSLLPNLSLQASQFINNPSFVQIIKEYGIYRFIGLNTILHLLDFNQLKDLLDLDHNGIKLSSYFSSEISKLLNRRQNVCQDLYEFVLNNTQGDIEADNYAYNLMLLQNFNQLNQALKEDRLKIKKDTLKLMHLKLLQSQQNPEVAALFPLLH